jgi:sulfite exporter TauE/SafE
MDWVSAILLGLVGSLHCAGMCGPLAIALPLQTAARQPGKMSSNAAFLLGRFAYNGGRIITYCFLGVIFGLAGKTFLMAGVQRWLSIALGTTLLAGLFASRRLALWQPVTALVETLKHRMAYLLRQRSLTSLGTLGLLNGFLPCGLVYVAAAGATATGGIFSGAQYMALFGLGTVPMMLTISLSGKLVPFAWRLKLQRAIPISVFLLATLLILRGMELGIPYVSPILSPGQPTCCHP